MKHSLVRTVGILAVALSLAAVAQAGEKRCEIRGLAGSWAYTETGTVVSPAPPNPTLATVAVGRYTFDRDGTLTAIQWGSTAGASTPNPDLVNTKKGTYTVDEDTCTITMRVDGYDGGGNWVRQSVWVIVLADNGREMRGISRSLLFNPAPPNGPWLDMKPVMTMTGTLVRDKGEEQER